MRLINIGFGNMVNADRIVAVVSPESAPIKRIIHDAEEKGILVNATYGRRTRAVIVTDSEHIIFRERTFFFQFQAQHAKGEKEKQRALTIIIYHRKNLQIS